MELGKAQELYDELMELESKLRNIRYGSDYLNRDTSVWTLSDPDPELRIREAIQLKSKLENFQFELELVLDDVRDVLRPSIEADIAATLPDNKFDELDESRALDAMAATITAPSETPVDTDSQQMATNLSGDVAITRDPYDVFIR
jgi:hypothetical protein|tara:strand:+ start:382 stop:816 length:435 start_codon:yes stop_codon:yes gene_type:complete